MTHSELCATFAIQSLYSTTSCLDDEKHMHRRFVSPQFPVEVDKCPSCARVWFDKDEIEVLQYLYELDHPQVASA